MDNSLPLYKLKPKVSRLMFKNYIIMVLLALLLHLGIIFNLNLMKITITLQTQILVGVLIVVLVIVNLFLIYSKNSKLSYLFYKNHIQAGNKSIMFNTITEVLQKKSFLDKTSETVTLQLGKETLTGIPSDPRIIDYIKKLIEYSKKL